jgi:hypothetical protein
MFHCCITSGRSLEAFRAYILVQPHRYIQVLLTQKCISGIEPATLGPRHSLRMTRSKIFPIRGAFDGE